MTKQVKRRKASVYLVRYSAISVSAFDRKVCNFVELFFNKIDALHFQKHNGGVLTRWSYQEQIIMPKKRGKK